MYKGFPVGCLLFWINGLKGNDMSAKDKLNAALIELYREIGRDMVEKEEKAAWGAIALGA
jgi:hypothetical protein